MFIKNFWFPAFFVILHFSCLNRTEDTDSDSEKYSLSSETESLSEPLRLTSPEYIWVETILPKIGCSCRTYKESGTGVPTWSNWACATDSSKNYDSRSSVPFECGTTYRIQYCKFSGGGSEDCYTDNYQSTPMEEFRAQVRTDYCPQHPTDPVCFEDSPAVDDSSGDGSDSGGGSGPGDPMPKGGSCAGTSDLATSVSGSVIECRDRSVTQNYDIVGTPYYLSYSSRNSIGGSYPDRIVTKSIRQFYPQPHYGKILKVNFITKIGDRNYTKSIPINRAYIQESDSVSQRVVWDGLDAAGQLVKGSIQGTTRIVIKTEFNPGGDGNGTVAKLFRFVMNNSSSSDRFNLGGWSISPYHSFDSASNLVFTGFGQRMPLLNLNTTPVWKTDADGNIFIPSSDAKEIYLFSPRGLHLKTFDAISNIATTTFQHDNIDRLISIKDKYGNTTTLLRSATGQLTGILSPYGELTKVNLNEHGLLNEIEDPAGKTTRFTYGEGSSQGLMLSYTNPNNSTKTYSYDSLGFLTQTIDAKGQIRKFADSTATRIFSNTSPYMEEIRVTSPLNRNRYFQTISNHDGTTDTIVRNHENDRGNILRSSINGKQKISRTRDGTETSMDYKSSPLFPQRVFLSNVTEKRPSGITAQTSISEAVNYENTGNPLSLTAYNRTINRLGLGITRTRFSKEDMQYTIVSPSGRRTTVALNSSGDPIKITSGGLAATLNTYNERGRLTSITRGSRTYTLGYDPRGLLTSLSNPLGQTTQFTYDANRRLVSQTLANGQVIKMQFDTNGNTTQVTTPVDKAYDYTFDNKDLLIQSHEPPLGGERPAWSWEYSLDDEPIKINQPDGTSTVIRYDQAIGKVEYIQGKSLSQSFQHDIATDRLLFSHTGDQFMSYEYDGTLVIASEWSGPVKGKVSFSWTPNYTLGSISVNGQPVVNYNYNTESEIVSANSLIINRSEVNGLISSSAVGVISTAMTYNNIGELTSQETYANGIPLNKQVYTRNLLGSITSIQVSDSNGVQVKRFGYDAIGQLISERTDGNLAITYNYDASGNRFQKGKGEQYDSHDRLMSSGNWIYKYSLNGNLVEKISSDGRKVSYDYDAAGNLLSVVDSSGTTVAYEVDTENHRLSRRINGVFKYAFLYQDAIRPIAQLAEDGSISSIFVYGTIYNSPDLIIKDGITYRVLHDHVGSPQYVINTENGEVVQKIAYDTWGNVLSDTNPGFQPFGFAGGLYDNITGLVRFGARDYDPLIARWLNKDPIGFKGGMNLYAYVGNDPVNQIDPLGTDVLVCNTAAAAGMHQKILVDRAIPQRPHAQGFGIPGTDLSGSMASNSDLPSPGGAGAGIVYNDRGSCTSVSRRFKTTPAEDDYAIEQLSGEIGNQGPYNAITNNCRTYANRKFDEIVKGILDQRNGK